MALFGGKKRLYGISHFRQDKLEIVFLKGSGADYELVGTEAVSTSDISSEFVSGFRSRLESYQARSPILVHLVNRNVALAKVFSVPAVSAG